MAQLEPTGEFHPTNQHAVTFTPHDTLMHRP
jgi:hypothetical protein